MMKYENLIKEFLVLNSEPSDEQVHQLAYAVGTDPETLESEIYAMFGAELNNTGYQLHAVELVDALDVAANPALETMPGLQPPAINDGEVVCYELENPL